MQNLNPLPFFRCLQCNWFGSKDDPQTCDHPNFQARLYGAVIPAGLVSKAPIEAAKGVEVVVL